MPGAFKLDHLQPFKPILYINFSNFLLLYWGRAIPYYPRKMRKWNSPNQSDAVGIRCLGHSNWTLCSPLSQFCSGSFPFFHFYAPEPISFIPQENEKMEFFQTNTGVLVLGVLKLDLSKPVNLFLF